MNKQYPEWVIDRSKRLGITNQEALEGGKVFTDAVYNHCMSKKYNISIEDVITIGTPGNKTFSEAVYDYNRSKNK
jgi:hypothetical protein